MSRAVAKAIERVLPYTDVFCLILKLWKVEKHRFYAGRDNKEILENLEKLSAAGVGIWIRIPVVGSVNDSEEEIKLIGEFLRDKRIRAEQVNLLPYHNTRGGKYGRVGMGMRKRFLYTG